MTDPKHDAPPAETEGLAGAVEDALEHLNNTLTDAHFVIARQLRAALTAERERAGRAEIEVDNFRRVGVHREELLRSWVDRYEAAEAQRDALKAALMPFANWIDKLDVEFGDHADDVIAGGLKNAFVTFGDLRRAREALTSTETQESEPDMSGETCLGG